MTEDGTPRTEHRMERVYPLRADPDEVWDAIATARGISSWMAPTQLDPRAGGVVSFDFGDLVSVGVVTDYRPPVRFAYEEPWPIPDDPEDVPPQMRDWIASLGVSMSRVQEDLASASPLATEFLVQADSGGTCILRVVTSAFGAGADWENEFFAEMVAGFVPLLDALAARFAGAAQ